MSVEINFQVDGLKELEEALTQLPKRMVANKGGPVKTALMGAALPVMRTAQATVPDRDQVENSGRLARSVKRRRITPRKGSEAVIVYVKPGKSRDDQTGAYYAPFVEFGALGMSPTDWLKNAMRSNVAVSVARFRQVLAGKVEKIARDIGNENLAKVGAKVKRL